MALFRGSHKDCSFPASGGQDQAFPLLTPTLLAPGSFPTPVLPVVPQWQDMIGTAFSLAIVGYVINLAVGRTLATKHGYDVDSNQVGKSELQEP